MAGPATAKSINSGRKLAGKVAIITGGASGIGEETARKFVNQGAQMVVIVDIQDDLGNQVAASIGSDRCSYFHCDVEDEKQVKQLVEWTITNHGKLDIMFGNIDSASSFDQTIMDMDLTEIDRHFNVNIRGMAACVKHAARAMMEAKVKGSIVCMPNVVASQGKPKYTNYVMSKHAVLGFVKCASFELRTHGIRVNCVSPYGLEELQHFDQNDMLEGMVLTTKHVTDAVLYLASDDSRFITGHDLLPSSSHPLSFRFM